MAAGPPLSGPRGPIGIGCLYYFVLPVAMRL
jgi:hypothetical protein